MILADMTDSSTLQTGATLLSVLMALVSSFFNWLQNRDRLRFDFERSSLLAAKDRHEEEIAKLKSESAKCIEDRARLSDMLEKERIERVQQDRLISDRLLELAELKERMTS